MREKFTQLTRRDALEQVLAGLEELEEYPSIHPIKINAVAMRDFTECEVLDFAQLSRRKPYVVRWIEFMPLDADQIWRKEDILTGAEIKAMIEDDFGPLVRSHNGRCLRDGAPLHLRRRHRRSRLHQSGQRAILPLVRPHPADRRRASCAPVSLPITKPTYGRWCAPSDDDETLAHAIRRAVWHKELKHHIGDTRFRRTARWMSMIGG